MKETIQISISGIAFFFDEEAYHMLENYLNKLEEAYRNHPDGAEIIADIEARIAEIILGKQESERIVEPTMIQEIISRLGFPEGMEPPVSESDPIGKVREKFSPRLYRNPDGARLGGVCNGFAAFLNIDPVWIRMAFFLPLILLILTSTFGLGFLSGLLGTLQAAMFVLYFLLWFAVPSARTPRQRLEMRGERITASSIEKSFREEFATSPADTPRHKKTATVWAEVVWVSGRIALFTIKAIAVLFSLFLIGIAIALIIGFFILLTSWDRIPELVEIFGTFESISPGLFLALSILIGLLPILLLLYLLLRMVFDLPSHRGILASIFGLWIIITVFVCVMTVRNIEILKVGVENKIRNELTIEPKQEMTTLSDSTTSKEIMIPDSLCTDTIQIQ